METKTIGFEGLHRCGKGTQINLLKEYFSSLNILSKVLRGDGARKGLGKEEQDPYCQWWQNNQEQLYSLGGLPNEQKIERINTAYQRLNKEINEAYQDHEQKVLILDRTVISRYFVMRQFNPNFSFEEALKVYDSQGGLTPIMVPQKIFSLSVPLDCLLERCDESTDMPEKKEFRRSNLLQHYDLYCSTLDLLLSNSSIKNRIIVIDGNKPACMVHQEIRGYLDT